MKDSQPRYFTWVDIESTLKRNLELHEWPSWLKSIECYIDGLSLYVDNIAGDQVHKWLKDIFGPRFSNKNGKDVILLENTIKEYRSFPVAINLIEEDRPQYQLRFSFDSPTQLIHPPNDGSVLPPIGGKIGEIPIIAFHSFKGGVGRTTAALALTHELVSDPYKNRVLLIDADMEAPGITFLLEERLPDPPISFADVLAMAHSDESSAYESTIKIACEKLQNSVIDGIYVLPAFRSTYGYESISIRPEHLAKYSETPFVISDLLRRLADELGVDVVIIDLRAGISEVSAGLLLDPTVRRVFVTSLSGQSIKGSASIVERIARSDKFISRVVNWSNTTPSGEITIVFSQVTDDQRDSLLGNAQETILNPLVEIIEDDKYEPKIIDTPYDGNLISLSRSWADCAVRIQRSLLGRKLRNIADFLAVTNETMAPAVGGIEEKRKRVQDLAENLEFAESGRGESFLTTAAIMNLASDHKSEVPIVSIVGQKGAGKSFTFLQLIKNKTWGQFISSAGLPNINNDIRIFPLLAPFNLQAAAISQVNSARIEVSNYLFDATPSTDLNIRDYVRKGFDTCKNETDWRKHWLNLLGVAVGLPSESDFEKLQEIIERKSQSIIFAIDGLEDLFQDIWSNENKQIALRALLQDVPSWLSQIPGKPIGLTTFVRRDMVIASIKQNNAQFLQRYRPYELRWSSEEALRLVYWVSKTAKVLSQEKRPEEIAGEDLPQELIPLWGLKLGASNSREAHSAEWVLSTLSDFRGQVQARDVIRLIKVAARSSIRDSNWPDRIITPAALRKSPQTCGPEKLNEITQESPELGDLFEKLRKLPTEFKKVPFFAKDVALNADDIDILEKSGVILRDDDGYYMPEMFRQGLGFVLPRGARPKILALARRARYSA